MELLAVSPVKFSGGWGVRVGLLISSADIKYKKEIMLPAMRILLCVVDIPQSIS